MLHQYPRILASKCSSDWHFTFYALLIIIIINSNLSSGYQFMPRGRPSFSITISPILMQVVTLKEEIAIRVKWAERILNVYMLQFKYSADMWSLFLYHITSIIITGCTLRSDSQGGPQDQAIKTFVSSAAFLSFQVD